MKFFSEDNYETSNIESDNAQEYSSQEKYSNEQQTNDILENNAENSSEQPFPNVFALFARSLGIFSVFCAVFSIFIGSFICGGLAIILAVLSKGYQTKMEKNAFIGLTAGVIGIILQISVLGVSIYNLIHVPEFREQFNSIYEQMYGEPVDDSINEILNEMGLPTTDTEGGLL